MVPDILIKIFLFFFLNQLKRDPENLRNKKIKLVWPNTNVCSVRNFDSLERIIGLNLENNRKTFQEVQNKILANF